jgi:hypothetical protein
MAGAPKKPALSVSEPPSGLKTPIGSTDDVSLADTPAGNAMAFMQMVYDIRDARKDIARHDAAITALSTSVGKMDKEIAVMAERVSHLPGKAYVIVVAVGIVGFCATAVGFGPQLQSVAQSLFSPTNEATDLLHDRDRLSEAPDK